MPLPVALVFILLALAITFSLQWRYRNLRAELAIANRDLKCLRSFLRTYNPAEVVKQVLAEKAAAVDVACDQQIMMQRGDWVRPGPLGLFVGKEELAEAFFEAYKKAGHMVKTHLEIFWYYRKIVLEAADATLSTPEDFGVDRNKSSWKDFLLSEKLESKNAAKSCNNRRNEKCESPDLLEEVPGEAPVIDRC